MNDGNGGKLLTRFELAEALAVHRQTVTKWLTIGLPVAVRGGRGRAHLFQEAEVLQWIEDRAAGNAESAISAWTVLHAPTFRGRR